VFDLVTETVGVQDIVEAAKVTLGVEAPVEYTGPQGDVFMEAMSTVSNSDTGRARAVLGWEPKRSEFVLNMSMYVRAWEAAQA
jgi:nucleoside-diphosphate-sugar epimerase